jgi:2-oxoisovalerate dehydrogenase E2 component (dihydrolipoyl transacylase)
LYEQDHFLNQSNTLLPQVDLSKVTATGKHGRVLKGDVLEYLNLIPAGTQVPHPTLVKSSSTKATNRVTADIVVPIKGVVRSMFKSMTESLVIFARREVL